MQPMLNIALRAARSAGELIVRSIERLDAVSASEKDAKDYVTEIGRTAEQAIITSILKAHPDHGINTEASGRIVGKADGADYEWLIEPLTGVINFTRGIPHFAVSIACKYRGRIEHAVIIDPLFAKRNSLLVVVMAQPLTAAAYVSANARLLTTH